jgi:Protein of unknown function (DUF3304)
MRPTPMQRKPNLWVCMAWLAAVSMALLTGCKAKPKMLGITGYNYTHRYIDGFSVDGQGGGNVLISKDDSGGGGTVCCIGFSPDQKLPVKVHVEWTYGERWNHYKGVKLQDAETHQADVDLTGPIPPKPSIFVVHFYPDHTVQVEVAASYPLPRLKRSDLKGAAHATRPPQTARASMPKQAKG